MWWTEKLGKEDPIHVYWESLNRKKQSNGSNTKNYISW